MSQFLTLCAWCPAPASIPAGVVVSHTICAKHKAEMLAEAKQFLVSGTLGAAEQVKTAVGTGGASKDAAASVRRICERATANPW